LSRADHSKYNFKPLRTTSLITQLNLRFWFFIVGKAWRFGAAKQEPLRTAIVAGHPEKVNDRSPGNPLAGASQFLNSVRGAGPFSPHPCPLPQGEGESPAALWKSHAHPLAAAQGGV